MNDFDERLRRLTADYNEPEPLDAASRDALWARIEGERADSVRTVRRTRALSPRRRNALQTGVAVAAVLLIGILIGRWSMSGAPGPEGVPVVASEEGASSGEGSPDTGAPNAAQRLYARDYLLRTETLLTEFRTAAMMPSPEAGTPATPWARSLLTETRLLLDSPVAEEPELTRLLRDLELILAEIVQLTESADERERREIRQSLEDRGVMLRLRNAVPAKAGTRGA